MFQSVYLLCQGQDKASAFHVVNKILNSQGFGLFPEDATWQWITRELVWSNTELGTSEQLRWYYPQPFSDLHILFFTAEKLAPKCGPLMTTNTGVFHCCGVLNSNDCTVAVIQFGKGPADHHLESHGALFENQYCHRFHWGLWFISGISRTSSGQARAL